MMLGYALIGAAVAVGGLLLAVFGHEGTRTATAMTMALVLGGSLCLVGVLQYLMFDENDDPPAQQDPLGLGIDKTATISDTEKARRAKQARRLSLMAVVVAGLGSLTLLAMVGFWFFG